MHPPALREGLGDADSLADLRETSSMCFGRRVLCPESDDYLPKSS